MPARKGEFGAALARAREDQGFETAYAFYRAVSGRRSLGLAFANYHNIETGKSLPQPSRVPRLLTALGLAARSPRAAALARAYLVSLLGSEELLEHLSPTPTAADLPSHKLAEEAAHQALSQRTVRLGLDAYQLLARDADAYACHIVLVNTPGWQEKRDLAEIAGVPATRLARPLAALARAGFVELSGGRARSRLAGKYVPGPPPVPVSAAIVAALARHRKAWVKKGRTVRHSYLTVRMAQPQLERYAQHLADAVKLSAVYGDVKREADTAVYLVESRLVRIFS